MYVRESNSQPHVGKIAWTNHWKDIRAISDGTVHHTLKCISIFYYKPPIQTKWLLLGSPMLMDLHLIQQNVGLQHTVLQP